MICYIMHDECQYQDSQTYHVRDDLRNLKQDYINSIRSHQNYDDDYIGFNISTVFTLLSRTPLLLANIALNNSLFT
jgi:hypothetical protein